MSKQLKKTTDTITKYLKNLSKNRTRLIAVGICAVIFVSVVMVQGGHLILQDYLDYDPDSMSSVTFGVYKYEDGEYIPIAVENLLLSPFRIGEEEVSEIAIRVIWTSTGQAIDWSTFTLTGSVDVTYLTEIEHEGPGGVPYWTPSWMPFEYIPLGPFTDANSEWSKSYVLGTDLCAPEHLLERQTGAHAGEVGWGYAFSGRVDGEVYDDFGGGPLTDYVTFGGLAVWITYIADWNLDAEIV